MATILIVEDERNLNEAYQMILGHQGHTIIAAYDGTEALKITEETEPDLILLDLRMPQMGGVEFLKKYNLKKDHPKVKVVIFSNLDTQHEIDEAYRLGAEKYMLKAWASPKELVQLVSSLLKKR
jgi:sigma-B regulation protein RsbU (phosphoserine phosphatase)